MAAFSPGTTPYPDFITALEAWKSVVGDTHEVRPMPVVHNAIWRVEAEAERVFVLKKLPEFAPGAGPVEAFRVLCHLQAAGVPVALPIVTDEGAIRAPVGERCFELVPFVPSDSGNHEVGPRAKQTSYAIGQAIARADRALLDCPWPIDSYVDDPAHDILDVTLPKLPAEIADRVQPFVDRLREATTGLPAQRTIGDCNSGNVLVHQGKVSAFIDLDHLPIAPRVRDLSDYLASRLRSQIAEGGTPPILAVLGDYVAGYHDTNPLSAQELAAIAPLLLLLEIGLVEWWTSSWVPNPARRELSVRAIEWLTEHFDGLVTAAAP
jgi:Ser/Thr protein kinase RdoA (MazF antagonist)